MNSFIISIDSSFEMTNNFFELFLAEPYVQNCEVVIVVDGNDSYMLREYLSKLLRKYDNLQIYFHDKVGYGIANNIAVEKAHGEILFFINTDVYADTTCFKCMENAISNNNGDCVQPLLLYPQNHLVQCAGTFFGNYFKDHLFDGNKATASIVTQSGERQALTSALYAMRKKVFIDAGGFDPFYFNKLESFELSYKLTLSGKKCLYLAETHAFHSRGGGRSQYSFDFTQQEAYFWTRYGMTVKPDIHVYLRKQLQSDMEKHSYYAIILNQHRDWIEILSQLPLSLGEIKSLSWTSHGTLNLFDILPHAFLRSRAPLLFVVNNIKQLRANKQWFVIRDNPYDIAMDNYANLVSIREYLE